MATVKEQYEQDVVPALVKEFGYANPHQVPKLEKIVLNAGVGESVSNSKAMEYVVYSLTQISGQKPVVTRARKSIANFKLREGMPIGCCVTMRKQRMYDFFSRLVNVATPRMRDFRGLPKRGFDGRGNYTLGIKEEIIFPEIDIDELDKLRGMNITFVTTARTDAEGRALLEQMGLPFRK